MHSSIFLQAILLAPFLGASALIVEPRQDESEATGTLTSGATATGTSPSSTPTLDIEDLCFPTDADGNDLPDAPCNLLLNTTAICVYDGNTNPTNSTPQASPKDQQSCFCTGAGDLIFEYLGGCFECERLHGAPLDGESGWEPVQYLFAQSSAYCAQPTPSLGLTDYLAQVMPTSSIAVGTSTGGIDVLGTSTQVGLYFTSTPVNAANVAGSSNAVTTSTTGSGTSTGSPTGTVTNSGTSATNGGASVTGTSTSTGSSTTSSSAASKANVLKFSGLVGAVALGTVSLL